MRKIDTLPQSQLVPELRDAIDAVRITDPLRGPSAASRRRLRRLIKENPHSIRTIHVAHNLGRARIEWLEPLLESELGS